MTKDYIGYRALTDAALRGVVRDALKRAEKQGLMASHHFCITFRTQASGVEIPDFLREQYPDEMTIILQHQYSGLKVKDDFFQVTLSFRKIPATLTVPFEALTQFADPGVQFALQFEGTGEQAPENRKPRLELQAAKPKDEPALEHGAPDKAAEIVSLDAFRKK